MHEALEKILLSEEEIKSAVDRIAHTLDEDYADKMPLAVCILKGSVMFYADLMRRIKTPMEFDFMAVSSYGMKSETAGCLTVKKDLSADVKGRDVLLVEDIVDSGFTLMKLKELLKARGAASVKIVALLDKKGRREYPITPDYCCFPIPNEFVVGYGLDYAERFRQLPYIGILKEEVYT